MAFSTVAGPVHASLTRTDVVVPSSASSPGACGSQWVTTLWLTNRTSSPVTARLPFLQRDVWNTLPVTREELLGAGESRRYDDVVGAFPGLRGVAGAIRIRATGEVLAVSRTFNDVGGVMRDSLGTSLDALPAGLRSGWDGRRRFWARRLEAERRVLASRFRIEVTPAMEAEECARVDRSTKAPEQWAAVQKTLGGRGPVERVVCGSSLVGRLVRGSFGQDRTIHAVPHGEARAARKAFLSGGSPEGANRRELSLLPGSGSAISTERLLAEAKAGRGEGRTVAGDPRMGGPEPVGPELAALPEKELVRPGDVSRILEGQDRFTVFRLVQRTDEAWGVDALVVEKLPLDPWLEEEMKGR